MRPEAGTHPEGVTTALPCPRRKMRHGRPYPYNRNNLHDRNRNTIESVTTRISENVYPDCPFSQNARTPMQADPDCRVFTP
jgi:hypothetical protein